MKKIIITTGPPASGKTMFTSNIIREYYDKKILHSNRDLMRDALTHGCYSEPLFIDGKYIKYGFNYEKLIDKMTNDIEGTFFKKDSIDILINSDTNLSDRLTGIVNRFDCYLDEYQLENAQIEIHTFFTTPLEELYKRNSERSRKVPYYIIKDMWSRIPETQEIINELVLKDRVTSYNH